MVVIEFIMRAINDRRNAPTGTTVAACNAGINPTVLPMECRTLSENLYDTTREGRNVIRIRFVKDLRESLEKALFCYCVAR